MSDVKGLQTQFQEAVKGQRRGEKCGMASALESMTPEVRDVYLGALGDDGVYHTTIAKVLAANGFAVKAHTVSRHRGGGCSCTHEQ